MSESHIPVDEICPKVRLYDGQEWKWQEMREFAPSVRLEPGVTHEVYIEEDPDAHLGAVEP